MPGALVAGLHDVGLDEGAAWAIADRVRVLLALPRPSTIGSPARTAAARLLDAWLSIEAMRVAIGLNTWEGVEYVDRDQVEDLLGWAVRLDAIDAETPRAAAASSAIAARLGTGADAAGYRVDRMRMALAAPAGRDPDADAEAVEKAATAVGRLAQQDPPEQRRGRRAVAMTDSRWGR
jgi:hypothetical protein